MKPTIFIIFLALCFRIDAQWGSARFKLKLDFPGQNELLVDYSKKIRNNLYDSIAVIREVEKLISTLQKNGFIAANTDSLVLRDTIVVVFLNPGERYRWDKISLEGFDTKGIRKKELVSGFGHGEFIQSEAAFRSVSKMLLWCDNNGYPFARISFKNVNFEENHTSATLLLNKLNKVKIDSVIVKGNIKLNRKFIYRQTGIFPETLYSGKKFRNLSRSLNSLPFLTFVREPGIEFRHEGADLYLFMDRQKANQFQGILGFLSDHRQSGKLILTGDIMLGLWNSFSSGESIDFSWKKTDVNNQELDLSVQWPFLAGSPVGAEGSFYLFRYDTLYMNINFKLAANFSLNEKGFLKAFYENKLSSAIGGSPAINLNDFETHLYGLGYGFLSIDHAFNPRRGWVLNSSFAFGKRILTTADNERSASNRFDLNLKAGYFLPLAKRSTVLFMSQSGLISLFENGESVSLLDNELYRLGGIKNLRGIDENSVLASTYSSLSLEYRWLIDRNSNIFVFTDGMYYKKNTVINSHEDFPFGFGLGLNLQTKAGVFSITYALGKQQGNPIELKSAKVHLGYLSRF